VTGTFAAFDAVTLKELWRDSRPVSFAKFCPPTIADGKVFRPTFHSEVRFGVLGKVVVYGLRPAGHIADVGAAAARAHLTIEQKYARHGAARTTIGTPMSEERAVGDRAGGRFRDFRTELFGAHGHRVSITPTAGAKRPTCDDPTTDARTVVSSSLYWTPATGAHLVLGAIRQHWLHLGGPASALGYPIADEVDTPDGKGRVSRFERGEIVWGPDTGASVQMSTAARTNARVRLGGGLAAIAIIAIIAWFAVKPRHLLAHLVHDARINDHRWRGIGRALGSRSHEGRRRFDLESKIARTQPASGRR
jgi:hypothetical protein